MAYLSRLWPRRTMRMRLTLLYAGLFLACALVLLVLSLGSLQHTSVAYARPRSATSAPAVAHAQPDVRRRAFVVAVAASQHRADLRAALAFSAAALVLSSMLSLALGWVFAGRALRPLRTMTGTARTISATNLDRRLDVTGPDDELKELGDTFDGLLGRLQRSFDLQRQFVANASHELRTPLATMRTSLDVAVAKPGPIPPQLLALADGLRQDLDQMDRLLDGLLTLARAQRGAIPGAVAVALDHLVAQALQRHQQQIAEMALQVDRRSCAGARVTGNETLLARMVGNLVDNAVVHNEPGGWIRIETTLARQRARLVVDNGGPRLDDAAVQRLAQPFARLGAARTGSDRGIGLGLSIVTSVAEVHGGTLRLDARDGGGLRASIDLPAAGSGA